MQAVRGAVSYILLIGSRLVLVARHGVRWGGVGWIKPKTLCCYVDDLLWRNPASDVLFQNGSGVLEVFVGIVSSVVVWSPVTTQSNSIAGQVSLPGTAVVLSYSVVFPKQGGCD